MSKKDDFKISEALYREMAHTIHMLGGTMLVVGAINSIGHSHSIGEPTTLEYIKQYNDHLRADRKLQLKVIERDILMADTHDTIRKRYQG